MKLQLSKEAAPTHPWGAPGATSQRKASEAQALSWSQLHFHRLETNRDVGIARTPMFCRFPGLKQLEQLNTSFFPLSEKHLLLVTKGLGMAYCVIA